MKLKVMMLLVLITSIFLISCTTAPKAEQCSVDADCIPAQCCHPTSAVNKAEAPDCSAVLCSMSCEGPLDCGAGEIKCVSNRCTIVPIK
ncbi:MAG TPA: hypothetical protein VJB13_03210 [Candidatus Nanoarchaeia archaeon]|nr:hypothetical protein [Candidatus Nanoarchaeia archaeon]